LTSFTPKSATNWLVLQSKTLLRFIVTVDNIEMIRHSDANIEWSSSDEDLDWLTVLNFYERYYFSNFLNCYELYSKLFELHDYVAVVIRSLFRWRH